jgi:hydroxymethylbilane synthase
MPLEKRKTLIVGTRGSPLALVQADIVKDLLHHFYPALEISIEIIQTSGDNAPYIEKNMPLQDLGGKGLFTKEVEEALLEGRIDIGVHSLKDVAVTMPHGLIIGAILPREDHRDVFITPLGLPLKVMPKGSRIGTSSLRRTAQVLNARPDLTVVPLRGNVQTRLQKMRDGQCDGTLMAFAGLKRLNLIESLSPEILDFLPAPAQGALGIQCRADDAFAKELLSPLNNSQTEKCVGAERAFLEVLDGNCRTPIAAHAQIDGKRLSLKGLVALNGILYKGNLEGRPEDFIEIGTNLGLQLKKNYSS